MTYVAAAVMSILDANLSIHLHRRVRRQPSTATASAERDPRPTSTSTRRPAPGRTRPSARLLSCSTCWTSLKEPEEPLRGWTWWTKALTVLLVDGRGHRRRGLERHHRDQQRLVLRPVRHRRGAGGGILLMGPGRHHRLLREVLYAGLRGRPRPDVKRASNLPGRVVAPRGRRPAAGFELRGGLSFSDGSPLDAERRTPSMAARHRPCLYPALFQPAR